MKRLYKGKIILLKNTLAKRVIKKQFASTKNVNWLKRFPKKKFF